MQELSWADLFPSYEDGFKKILKAIKKEKNDEIKTVSTKQINIIQDLIISIKSKAATKKKHYFSSIISLPLIIITFLLYNNYSTIASFGKKILIQFQKKMVQTDKVEEFINSIGMKFVYIPPGTFFMGSPEGEKGKDDDEVLHKVIISKGFYLQTSEVTQKQWTFIMGYNSSNNKKCGENCPVEQVSWEDAKDFIKKLNEKERLNKYRLPTEAEWEYACRAGETKMYYFGDDHSQLIDYAWYSFNSDRHIHQIALKKPNKYGLYDMLGNVYEWCEDRYSRNYEQLPKENPLNNPEGFNQRVIRGMTFFNQPLDLRCANRNNFMKSYASGSSGFRVARDR